MRTYVANLIGVFVTTQMCLKSAAYLYTTVAAEEPQWNTPPSEERLAKGFTFF
jgi:hypothetical protein